MKKNNRIIAFGLLVVFGFSCILTGCDGIRPISSVKEVKLTERERNLGTIDGGNVEAFEFEFTDDIQGVSIYKELWENGKCVENRRCAFGGSQSLKELYIKFDMKYETATWIMKRFDGDGGSASMPLGKYEFDIENEIAWSYGWIDDVELVPNESYVLFANGFVLGDGMLRGFSNLSTYDKVVEQLAEGKEDVVMLIRLDTYATEEEANRQ